MFKTKHINFINILSTGVISYASCNPVTDLSSGTEVYLELYARARFFNANHNKFTSCNQTMTASHRYQYRLRSGSVNYTVTATCTTSLGFQVAGSR